MTKGLLAAMMLLTIWFSIGCAGTTTINVDGMPISNHEYNLTNDESGIRTVFVLARYYREYHSDEFIVKPEYLDALQVNRIEPEKIEKLILHIKVINLKNVRYSMNWEIIGPDNYQVSGLLYSGILPRKDFSFVLPVSDAGFYSYSFHINDESGDDLFPLPLLWYKMKGGAKKLADNQQ